MFDWVLNRNASGIGFTVEKVFNCLLISRINKKMLV